MKSIREFCRPRHRRGPSGLCCGAVKPVGRPVIDIILARSASDHFHDVQFPACRPGRSVYIFTQHPESRPYALPIRRFYPGFNPAVCKMHLVIGGQPRGRKAALSRPGLHRVYDQVTARHITVRAAVSIILPFAVPKGIASRIIAPVRGVYGRAVKFIRPYEVPACGPENFNAAC